MKVLMGVQKPAGRTNRRTQTFRSVADFLSVPAEDIGFCLRSFEEWLHRANEIRRAAEQEGKKLDLLDLAVFTWHARTEPSSTRPTQPYPAATDVRDLGLRPSAMHELLTHNLYALEDFTQASEDELLAMPNVGRATMVQIRSLLQAIGLDFRQSANPKRRAANQALLAKHLPPSERRIDDEAPISGIGLRSMTALKCIDKGIETVGDLGSKTLRELWIGFGEKTVLEIAETLESVGLELHCKPAQLEKWQFRAIRPERLAMPDKGASVVELEPWLGAICGHLHRAGVLTVADAEALTREGTRQIRGIGPNAWRRLQRHFGVPSLVRLKAD